MVQIRQAFPVLVQLSALYLSPPHQCLRGAEHKSSINSTPLMIYPTPVLIPTPFYYHVAPPDFKNLLPDGNPPPPAVEGLSDEWTWEHPSSYPVIRTRVTQEQYGDQIREGPVKTRGKEKTPIGIVILNQTARRKKSIHLTRNGEGGQRTGPGAYNPKPASIILPI